MIKMYVVRLGSVHRPVEGQHGERGHQEVRPHVHAAAGAVVRGPTASTTLPQSTAILRLRCATARAARCITSTCRRWFLIPMNSEINVCVMTKLMIRVYQGENANTRGKC
jgi:hypothetical protein